MMKYEKGDDWVRFVDNEKVLELKTAKDWIKFINDKFSIPDGDIGHIDYEILLELQDLIEHIPREYGDKKFIEELRKISENIHRAYYALKDKWSGSCICPFSINDSIAGRFHTPKDQVLNDAFTDWYKFTCEDYVSIKLKIHQPCTKMTIDLLKLAEMELRELNKFFDSGVCNSIAINVNEGIFRTELEPKEIFEYYLKLIRGRYDFFIIKDDYIEFCELHNAISKEFSNRVNADCDLALDKCKQADKALKKEWWLAARVQALLWIKINLEEVVNIGSIKDQKIIFPKIPIDDLGKPKKGFQVKNKTVIPALHKALLSNGLIAEISVNDFEKAFVDGEGSIQWLLTTSNKKNSLDAISLIYFIERMAAQDLIIRDDYIATTSRIFIDKNEKKFKHSTLTTATKEKPANKNLLNEIVDSLKNK